MLFAPYVCLVLVTEWPPVGEKAGYSACYTFSRYKYFIVNFVSPASVFGVGIPF